MGDFFTTFADALPQLLSGIRITLILTASGAVLALVLSFLFGLMSRSRSIMVRGTSRVIVEFFRGTSLVVQLFWFVYAMPIVTGFQLDDPVYAGIIALGLNYGAYGAEVVRGGLNAVPQAQWEATIALNMTPLQRLRLVIVPQAMAEMIPPFGNLLIQLLKASSLVVLVGIADLSFEAEKIRLTNATEATAAFSISLVLYFVLAWLLNTGMRAWEGHAKAKLGRPVPRKRLLQPVRADQGGAV
ncbi:ectoine/hydroxyectoine ABC transporter permease subunit EhuC [Phytomonospora endophytica]|uniref:Polar amino acid transport system permease protein n=1 Tax=Phytomonospora endophytica TaxID=714109 RepID=A0A841F7V8_9ACTN|nr:ectoine/hydroxyectoine ABC transporter permease subunit EhuC [Phytomonospora endophytica]MBB6033131.1 polar amino acid transport system permease protein [Phytomonospora endophytica]GIG65357.1 ectoine/hydroxyectoine ABC transporter permease subunit EhuC [Phytomonospora endophytica]